MVKLVCTTDCTVVTDCHCYWLFVDMPFNTYQFFCFIYTSMRNFLETSPDYDVSSFIVLGSILQRQFAHTAYTNISANANCRLKFLHIYACKSHTVTFFSTLFIGNA